jgi:hypothetical protein
VYFVFGIHFGGAIAAGAVTAGESVEVARPLRLAEANESVMRNKTAMVVDFIVWGGGWVIV